MTWQRIDENTYIDNSLVTCVEYQLFINEMREQGKYFQPDHWTSYEFIKGQAGEPALGVRPSDAIAFCNWLTERREDRWGYRVPISEEQKEYPVLNPYSSLVGCWTMGKEKEIQIAFIGEKPNTLPVADRSFAHQLDRARARFRNYAREYLDKSDIASRVNRELRNDATADPPSLDVSRILEQAIERVLPRATALNIDYMFTPRQSLTTNSDLAFEHAPDNELIQYLDRGHLANASTLEKARERALNLACDRAGSHSHFRNIDGSLDQNINSAIDNDRDHAVDYFINIFIDLFTIQERIAGRSPAFEGIRLVKERMR